MNEIRPLNETAESVTLSRSDYEAIQEELEDALDRAAVLEDCLLDQKPQEHRYLLTMDETMRILDGGNPISVWREKRGMTIRHLADALGLHEGEIESAERGEQVSRHLLGRIASALDVTTDMLVAPKVAP